MLRVASVGKSGPGSQRLRWPLPAPVLREEGDTGEEVIVASVRPLEITNGLLSAQRQGRVTAERQHTSQS